MMRSPDLLNLENVTGRRIIIDESEARKKRVLKYIWVGRLHFEVDQRAKGRPARVQGHELYLSFDITCGAQPGEESVSETLECAGSRRTFPFMVSGLKNCEL
jgi:hypothetical protein